MSLPSPVYSLPERRIWLLLPNHIHWVVRYISFFFFSFFLNLLLIHKGFSFNGMSKWTLVKNHRRKKKKQDEKYRSNLASYLILVFGSLGLYLGVEWLHHMIILFNFLKNCQIVFCTDCTILYSHQQHCYFPISPLTLFFFLLF